MQAALLSQVASIQAAHLLMLGLPERAGPHICVQTCHEQGDNEYHSTKLFVEKA